MTFQLFKIVASVFLKFQSSTISTEVFAFRNKDKKNISLQTFNAFLSCHRVMNRTQISGGIFNVGNIGSFVGAFVSTSPIDLTAPARKMDDRLDKRRNLSTRGQMSNSQ